MKNRFIFAIVVFVFGCTAVIADEMKLWYVEPARTWVEALPVGNSRMGVMQFGGTEHERLQLNEETFWAGGPHNNDNPRLRESLAEIRSLIFAGRYGEAQ